MPKLSAGLLPFRRTGGEIEVFLVHPGGPFWKKKDAGAWSIAKGEYESGDDPLAAALREFEEETSFRIESCDCMALGEVRQAGGKLVQAWAVERDLDPAAIRSNTFEMAWPPRSGKMQEFPEVDRAAWFPLPQARIQLLAGQVPFLERLAEQLSTI
jgi:predicted NUDIX family NTP pyrophosphohydrolase